MPPASPALGPDRHDVVVVVYQRPRPAELSPLSHDRCTACGFDGQRINSLNLIGAPAAVGAVEHPHCLALVRTEAPPQDWKDFLDRQLRLLSSAHWTWSRTAQLIAIPSGFATVAAIYAAAARLLPHLPGLPEIWMPVAGGVALLGGIIARLRRGRGRA